LNIHTSLLPKYRGAAPIQWAILDDEPETGVTIMQMNAGLDTGDILTRQTTPIRVEDNSQTLHDRLAQIGAGLIITTIHDLVAGRITPRPQPAEGATYARKITKEDGRLDWKQPARVLWNRTRAFTPWPGAFTYLPAQPKPLLLKIWETEVVSVSGEPGKIIEAGKSGLVVGCGENSLRIKVLQREGGRRLSAQEFLTGHPLKTGESLD
jgi:methionyl-tRNA formyltransferase